jgi:hypothetical protein
VLHRVISSSWCFESAHGVFAEFVGDVRWKATLTQVDILHTVRSRPEKTLEQPDKR